MAMFCQMPKLRSIPTIMNVAKGVPCMIATMVVSMVLKPANLAIISARVRTSPTIS